MLTFEEFQDTRTECEAWDALLRHVVPVEWAVYRHDRSTGEEIDCVSRGFLSGGAAMDAANVFQRLNPSYRYVVGEV